MPHLSTARQIESRARQLYRPAPQAATQPLHVPGERNRAVRAENSGVALGDGAAAVDHEVDAPLRGESRVALIQFIRQEETTL